MNNVDIAFRDYWNAAQPLFAIQHKSGISLQDVKVTQEIRAQVEQAYRAGWADCGKAVIETLKKT